MEVDVVLKDSFHIASVTGRVDAVNAGDFEKKIKDLIQQGAKIIVMDMSGLEYINSAGIRSILLLAKNIRSSKGKMCFSGMQPSVEEVFDISGFKSLFSIFPSTETAFKAGSASWR